MFVASEYKIRVGKRQYLVRTTRYQSKYWAVWYLRSRKVYEMSFNLRPPTRDEIQSISAELNWIKADV